MRASHDVYVAYDGQKVSRGLRNRVRKKFPGGWGRNGLKREVKVFYFAQANAGKAPVILDADGVTPLFGPQSKAAQRLEQERKEEPQPAVRPETVNVPTDPQSYGQLFDNTGLPD